LQEEKEMDLSVLIKALAPAFAAGFALQRLLEILDPILDRIKNGESKKIVLGLVSFAAGLALAAWPKIRVLNQLIAPEAAPAILDYLVTALIVSGGTEGFNSIIKFLSYKKEETKAGALNQSLAASVNQIRVSEAMSLTTTKLASLPTAAMAGMTSNECIVWRQGEFRVRVRRAVAEWAQEPVDAIMPNNTLGELAKNSDWNAGQQARLVQAVNANQVFAPPFPDTRMAAPSQLVPSSTTVAQWEKLVWRQQDPETDCFPFTE